LIVPSCIIISTDPFEKMKNWRFYSYLDEWWAQQWHSVIIQSHLGHVNTLTHIHANQVVEISAHLCPDSYNHSSNKNWACCEAISCPSSQNFLHIQGLTTISHKLRLKRHEI
jgi:hypothetical protein